MQKSAETDDDQEWIEDRRGSYPIQKVNEAYERLSRAEVKYRFSIDMTSLKSH